jgi:hypothetical protein
MTCPAHRSSVPAVTVHEHKPERLIHGCHCGLQAGHPGDCEPPQTEPRQENAA